MEEFFSCGNAQFGSIFFIREQLKCSRMKKMLPLCHVVVVTPKQEPEYAPAFASRGSSFRTQSRLLPYAVLTSPSYAAA